jgi:hypothetical protein
MKIAVTTKTIFEFESKKKHKFHIPKEGGRFDHFDYFDPIQRISIKCPRCQRMLNIGIPYDYIYLQEKAVCPCGTKIFWQIEETK